MKIKNIQHAFFIATIFQFFFFYLPDLSNWRNEAKLPSSMQSDLRNRNPANTDAAQKLCQTNNQENLSQGTLYMDSEVIRNLSAYKV